jgi:LysM repeat protein
MKFFAVLSIFVGLVAAAPTLEDQPLETREDGFVALAARQGCYVPNDPDWNMVKIGYQTCIRRNCNARQMLALMETGAVESNWHNLDCGDKDSEGIYQQRASVGAWGTRSDIRNPQTSTNNFLDALFRCNPNMEPGAMAQCAQRSEIPDAYRRSEARARGYLQEAQRRWGNNGGSASGGSANVGSKPGSSSGGSSSGGCAASVKAVKGDSCAKIAGRGKISVATLKSLNGSINKNCTNIKIGQSYCTKKGSSAPSKSTGGGGCKTVKAVKGDSCAKVAGRGKVSLSKFMSLNKSSINSKCTNLQVGRAYCVN